jgi:hypothetical protein
MKNTLNALVFFGKFAILGLALAFVVSEVAPNWTARIRGQAAAPGKIDATPAPVTSVPPPTEPRDTSADEREPARPSRGGEREQTT